MTLSWKIYAFAVISLFITASPGTSHANGFMITPSSCTPTSGTLQAHNFVIGTDGSITLKSGITTITEIRMNCIVPQITANSTFTAIYSRTGGSLALSYIKVDINGQETLVAGITANDTSGTRHSQSTSFTDAIHTDVYFVEIDFTAVSSNNLTLYGIEIQ